MENPSPICSAMSLYNTITPEAFQNKVSLTPCFFLWYLMKNPAEDPACCSVAFYIPHQLYERYYYCVGQKVHLGCSLTAYGKT